MKIIVLRGLPGSGKSTWCKSQPINSISKDEMKEWMPGWYEKVVKMWREAGFRCLQVQDGNF